MSKTTESALALRHTALLAWLTDVLGESSIDLLPVSGDASFRRYYRVVTGSGSVIVMDAPPPQEDCRGFVAVAEALDRANLCVPRVLHQDLERGFLVLSDLGDTSYLQMLTPKTADWAYSEALAALARMQLTAAPPSLPRYDEGLLLGELALFGNWLLDRHLGKPLTDSQVSWYGDLCQVLVENALAQPQVWVHRDFHSRNLMWLHDDSAAPPSRGGVGEPTDPAINPGILDFQDAVIGPLTYDLVSLLRDCYVAWPQERVRGWALAHARVLHQAGLLQADDGTFLNWFDLMGVQRHLKAAGIFARLWHRDGKAQYLADIPRTLRYVVAVCQRSQAPGLRQLGELLTEQVLPGLARAAAGSAKHERDPAA